MGDCYTLDRRERPADLQRRKRTLGLPIGAKQDYARPWMLLKDGMPIGYYETEAEAQVILSELEDLSRE